MPTTFAGYSDDEILAEARLLREPGYYGELILYAVSGKIVEMRTSRHQRADTRPPNNRRMKMS